MARRGTVDLTDARGAAGQPPMRPFDELVAEAAAADVAGWDFRWLDGRATEERPSWGYQQLISERLGVVSAALDVQTGGGEVLSGVARSP